MHPKTFGTPVYRMTHPRVPNVLTESKMNLPLHSLSVTPYYPYPFPAHFRKSLMLSYFSKNMCYCELSDRFKLKKFDIYNGT